MLSTSQYLQKRLNELIYKENILIKGCQLFDKSENEICELKEVDYDFLYCEDGTCFLKSNENDYWILGRQIDLGLFCLAVGRVQNIQIDFSEYDHKREVFVLSIESLDEPVPTFDCEIEYDCSKDFHNQDEDFYEILGQLFDYEESWILS